MSRAIGEKRERNSAGWSEEEGVERGGGRGRNKDGRVNKGIIRSGLSDTYREIGSAGMQFRDANLNWKIIRICLGMGEGETSAAKRVAGN